MAEHKLISYFLVMLGINVLLFLVQGGVEAVNSDSSFWDNSSSSPAVTFLQGDDLSSGFGADNDDIEIVTSDSVEETTGNIFTDTFKTIKSWFTKLDTRFRIVGAILSQPYGFMRDIGVPLPIATAFALLWYIALVFLLVSFIKGGVAD